MQTGYEFKCGIGTTAVPMDSCVVDITAIAPAEPLDKTAVIFDHSYTPKDIAAASDSIAYEIMTTLGERTLRHYDD